jgi:hypothetical protein
MKHYSWKGCDLELAAPVEVGRAKGHFWFPSLHTIQGRELFCEAVLAADKAQGKWAATLCLSQDGGVTWRRARDIDSYGPTSIALGPRKVLLMPYELWPLSPGDKRNAVADGTVIHCREDGAVELSPAPVKYLGFPRDLADYHVGELELLTNGNILPLRDGTLLTTLYGTFAGEEKYCNFAVTSDDEGFTWRFRSVVASWADLPDLRSGPNESNSVRLSDGRIMCVYRVQSGGAYHSSCSSDEGATWTKPRPVAGAWSVEPGLVRLENGIILLSGGRHGLFLWVCADGAGENWERVNLAEHHNASFQDASLHYSEVFCKAAERVQPDQSTAYTGIRALGPDEALVCYDRLANGWSGAPGPWGGFDTVFCVRIKALRP